MTWLYKGNTLNEEDIPPKACGFIYLIRQLSTGRLYIGRKLLTSAATKTVNGKKKKIRKESDWKDYWSSSPKIKAWIEESGTSDFSREILQFVTSKGMLAYAEEYALYTMGVLESDDWLNDNIRSKVYRTWVKRDEAVQLRKLLEDMKKGSQEPFCFSATDRMNLSLDYQKDKSIRYLAWDKCIQVDARI